MFFDIAIGWLACTPVFVWWVRREIRRDRELEREFDQELRSWIDGGERR